MKKTLLVLLTGASLGISSCFLNPDACSEVTCNNGGVCIDGQCECVNGYAGVNCDDEARLKFIGNFSGAITREYYPDTITSTCNISASSTDLLAISIQGLIPGSSTSIIGNIYRDNGYDYNNQNVYKPYIYFEIPSQSIPTGSISGIGEIDSAGNMTISYSIDSFGNIDGEYDATLTRL